ncbi:MAG: GGDEF domain-containing protein [Corynebacteriales bacterium]|uniref:GGDEF domain-containing protein n=1 Tax=Williamsia herbipolensis TaxID=1603258 RepID=A0AAU4K0N5_9NOCA|nr:GGDEF domain-containing protein [Williamsia herbipolensis]MCX6468857.1 GGDEF domain-containing protein [Mycobacteriales bacterium]
MTPGTTDDRVPDLSDLIAGTATGRVLRRSVGFGSANFGIIAAWVALDTSIGPTSTPLRLLVGLSAVLAVATGVLWAATDRMLNRLPCTLFGVFAEIGTALVVLAIPDPRNGLVGCALLAVLGAQFTLLMASRWLFLHLAAAALVIGVTSFRLVELDALTPTAAALAAYVLAVSSILTPWGARIVWTRLLVYAARSRIDPLTGLLNRAGLDHAHQRLLEQARSGGIDPQVLAVLDIDDFKSVNDSHGHVVGDRVIREVAMTLRRFATSGRGVVARTGGEEFTLMMPASPDTPLTDVGGRLPLTTVGRDGPSVTLSAGVVPLEFRGADRFALAHALTEADRLMYDAKRRGGARAAVHSAG